MASRPIFDTNIIIQYRSLIEPVLFSAYIPSIVFFELLASSVDHSFLKTLTRWRTTLKEIDQVLSPTETDFWETGKSINRLYLKKSAQESKLKTLRMDALIARLAVKSKNFIVTVDTDDFEIIKKDMKQLVIVSAHDFFSDNKELETKPH